MFGLWQKKDKVRRAKSEVRKNDVHFALRSSYFVEDFIGSAEPTENVAPSGRGTFDKIQRTKPRVPRLWGLNGRQLFRDDRVRQKLTSSSWPASGFSLVDMDQGGFFTSPGPGAAHGGRSLDVFEEFESHRPVSLAPCRDDIGYIKRIFFLCDQMIRVVQREEALRVLCSLKDGVGILDSDYCISGCVHDH